MPVADSKKYSVDGAGFLRLAFMDLTTDPGKIDSWETELDIGSVSDQKVIPANPREDTEYHTKELTTGVTSRIAKRKSTWDIKAQADVAAGDAKDKITCTIQLDKATKDAIIAGMRAKKPITAIVGMGRLADDNSVEGFSHLMGYIEGDFERPVNAGINDYNITIAGGVVFVSGALVDEATYNTALVTAKPITPDGMSALTLKAIDATDYANLLKGQIVDTDPA